MKRCSWGLTALLLLLAGAGRSKADVVYTLNDTANHVSATALFKAVAGGIEIIVTNTEANTPDAGHAISQIQFTIGGGLARPTAFREIAGTETDFAGSTRAVDVAPTSTQHWSFQSGGSTASLWTVDGNGLVGYGGQPTHLIAAAGSSPDSSLAANHLPSFVGPVDFFLADSSVPADLTLADITGVKFSFGTGPEVNLEAATPVPAPGGLALLGIGAACLGLYARRRQARA
jgi:hypothetical protein